MPNDSESKMIGLEMVMNMTDKDRAQEIWDKAMRPEAKAFMLRLSKYNAGLGPDPGNYTGPVIDFEKAAADLEKEKPATHPE